VLLQLLGGVVALATLRGCGGYGEEWQPGAPLGPQHVTRRGLAAPRGTPLLVRVEMESGHGAGKPTDRLIDASAEARDVLARQRQPTR